MSASDEVAANLLKRKDLLHDSLRNCERIEIPAGIALFGKTDKHLLDAILTAQHPDGFWAEYSYEPTEEKVGYFGAVPTAFCILALLKGYERTKNKGYLYAAIRGSDFLYAKEKGGYFYKAQINKTDVLNTNLLCGFALVQTSKFMDKKAKRVEIYRAACARTIRRSTASQHWNGAYPYTSHGMTVPLLYHAMTLALLVRLSSEFKDSLLDYSVIKGAKYLRRFVKKDGSLAWDKEQFSEKSGASWAYAWAHAAFSSVGDDARAAQMLKHLESLFGKQFFYEGDSSKKEDPFFSAWCLLALSFVQKVHPKKTIGGRIKWHAAKWYHAPKKLWLIKRIVQRKLFSGGLDSGPVEYW